jgi:acetyl esterase/lipase
MTLPTDHPLLEQAADVLREHSLAVAPRVLEGLPEPVLVVESPFVVAVLLAAARWRDVAGEVYDTQVALANWASGIDTTSRRWDLYVVALIESWPDTPEEGAQIEQAEADTTLARKVVRSGIVTAERDRVRDALRPLLPLQPVGRAVLPDVAEALEERLRVHGVNAETAERAISGFLHGGTVWL